MRELIQSRNVSVDDVNRLLGLETPPQVFRKQVVEKGRATPQERARIAEILGVTKEEVEAALAETVRRPGERDSRGRKKGSPANVGGA